MTMDGEDGAVSAGRSGARAARALALAAALLASAARADTASGEPADGSGPDVGTGAADTVAAGGAAATLLRVAPGHHVHVGRHASLAAADGEDIAVGGFVVGERSVAVIDPGGGDRSGGALRRALRRVTPLPISHLVLSHFHPDHALGAGAFADAAEIVAHEHYARARDMRGAFYLGRFGGRVDAGAAQALPGPTRTVAAGESLAIDLGGRRLVVRGHPVAHTDNDVSVHDEAAGVLWAGDLLFAERTPALDGSLVGWLAVMDELAALGAATVVPGHGAPGAAGPIAARQRRYLEALLADTRARLAANGRLADAIAAAEAAASGEGEGWALHAEQHPTNVTRAWAELEWE